MLANEAREAFSQNDPFWAVGLANALEKFRAGSSLTWGRNTLRRILSRKDTPLAKEQRSVLQSLDALVESPPPPAKLMEMAETTWYHPDRDSVQTALSRLFAVLANQVGGYSRGALSEFLRAMNVMCHDETVGPEALDIALAEFESLAREMGLTEESKKATPVKPG